MIRIIVDNLSIRLKGLPIERAKLISANLGEQLMEQIADHQLLLDEKTSARFDSLDAGVIRTEYDVSSLKLGELMASRIANSIFDSINRTYEEER